MTLPPLPSHPEHAWLWTEAEKLAIASYGKACAAAAEAATIERCAALLDAEHARDKHMHNYAACYARMLREMKP